METAQNKLQYHFFLVLLIGVLVIMFYIFRPFLGPIILALSFSVLFRPLYKRILKNVGNRANIAALISVLIILIVVFLPLVLVGSLLFAEAQTLYSALTSDGGGVEFLNKTGGTIERYVQRICS